MLNNLGNGPSADTPPLSFVRLGVDSPDFLKQLAAEDPTRLSSFVTRTDGLPVYGVTAATCPTLTDPATDNLVDGTNQRTTDPGRALVSGSCADLGTATWSRS